MNEPFDVCNETNEHLIFLDKQLKCLHYVDGNCWKLKQILEINMQFPKLRII